MNQQNILRERKSNISRQTSTTKLSKNGFNSNQARKRVVSSAKKVEIEDICQINQNNRYLIGWGNIPCLPCQTNSMQIINKDIASFEVGQDHIIFMNLKQEVYGIGSNKYGQLGKKDHIKQNVINRVFQDMEVKKIFCNQYNTFIINNQNDLYACGLNNRGQLGVSTFQQQIREPRLVLRLSQFKEDLSMKRRNSRTKISSIYYQEMKKQNHQVQASQQISTDRSRSLLDIKESIVDIRGGPFHTVALTSKGRLFYTGILYKSSSLLKDQFSSEFMELKTSFLGRVIAVKSHLNGICFLTCDSKLYLLGLFGERIFQQPELVQSMSVMDFDVNGNGVYVVDLNGDFFYCSIQRSCVKCQKIPLNQRIKNIWCGLDFTIVVTKQGKLLGKGDNSQKQLINSCHNNYPTFQDINLTLDSNQTNQIKCSNNFVLALTCKPPYQTSITTGQINKFKDIQRQNKLLKQLLCNKSKKSVKIQTDKESKFDIMQPLNARTFDTSLEIPFQQLTLGKQISEGGYGIIYKATWRKSTVAVKIFKIQKDNQNAIRDFVSQCHAMQALRHPNIVMFLGACTKPPHFAIVLQYCEGGTLWSLLQKKQELSWEDRRGLALQTAKGMNYLHQRNVPVLHRDLKSLNLLLDHSKHVKLADFGWTKGLQNYMTGKIGTYQWMAPQVISAYQYTEKADVFSFGIILWQIASREAPYRNIPGPQVAHDVLMKDLRPIIPKRTPDTFAELIRQCWNKNPQIRPSFSSIITILEQMIIN